MRTTVATFLFFLGACGSSTRPVDSVAPMLDSGAGGATSETSPATGFVHSQGTTLVDGSGNILYLKGVSLGNQVWSNVAVPGDHNEIDFGRLQAMGANSTRFLLNYVTFEDDAAPNVYKQAGWDWLDLNVQWAKAHGIHLIFNMHVPQGGFQSNGAGGRLWSDSSNQDRLVALWTAIAARYGSEAVIAAFDLVNEPQPLANRQQWQALATRIATSIRTVDTNHMILVERTNAVAGDWNNDVNMNLFAIDDANVAYEFHFYEPTDYTFQLQPWNNTPEGGSYPDPTKVGGVTETWLNLSTFDSPKAPAGDSDWTYHEGAQVLAAADNPNIAVGKPTLQGMTIGTGTIAFDDLSIKEFDGNGNFVREVVHILPTSSAGWYFWSKDNSGTSAATSSCKTSSTCLSITGTLDDANLGGYDYYFVPTKGYQYSLSGWMKGTNLPATAVARLRLDLVGSSSPISARNRSGLANMMAPYLAWGKANNVPLFLGEFGVYKACFADNKGGTTWVNDVYDIATGAGGTPPTAGLSYHQYHEDAFALYYGIGPVNPANANQPLIDLLTAKMQAAP